MVLGLEEIAAGPGTGRGATSGLSAWVQHPAELHFMSHVSLKPVSHILQVMAARGKLITCFKSPTHTCGLPCSYREDNEVLQAEGVARRLPSLPQHRASGGQAICPGLEAAQDTTDPPMQR